jgi:hypothetical protein
MTRVQIHLKEEEDRWLEERAAALGTTKSALMREGLRLLQEQNRVDIEHMLKLIGLADRYADRPEEADDVAELHDKYLIDAEFERWRDGG